MPQEYQHHKSSGQFSVQGILLYILPAPLIVKLFISIVWFNLSKIAFTAAALFFFYSAAHLTRTSLLRLRETPQHRQNSIKDNRYWGAIYVAVGVLILMLMIRRPWVVSLFMTGCAFVGYWWTYGLPQKATKRLLDDDSMPKATREAIQQAYTDLEEIATLGQQLSEEQDTVLAETLDKVIEQSYVIMDLLVKTPEDVGRARRFLNVYINRIKEILQQYLKLAKHGKAEHLRQRLIETLAAAEKAFREKKSQLLDDDIFKLDIQLEVLDEQIKHEE